MSGEHVPQVSELPKTDAEEAGVEKPGEEKEEQCKNPWVWFWESPLSRYPFAIFCMTGLLTAVWLVIYAISETLIVSGIAGIGLGLYGAFMFKTLIKLKAEVDRFAKANQALHKETAQIAQEVNRLADAEKELQSVERDLVDSNKKLRENVQQMTKLNDRLEELGDANIEGLQKLKDASKAVSDSIGQSLIGHEKKILMKVFDWFERKFDSYDSITEEHFNELFTKLPASYLTRFQQMGKTYKDYAGEDGLMQFDEFKDVCDNIAEHQAKGGGSY